jgi:hypothetical protein
MKQKEFWEKVELRARENREISGSGMPNVFARVTEWVGLRFLVLGGVVSFMIAWMLWLFKYDAIMRFVRVIVWR